MSTNISMVVGLAVDYVVHLAEGYHMSTCRGRKERVKSALRSMAMPVFSAACTSIVASIFMTLSKLKFMLEVTK